MLSSVFLYLSAFASICVAYLVLKLARHLMRMWEIKKAFEKMPSSKVHWALGHLHEYPSNFGEDCIEYFRRCNKERPRCEVFWAGNWVVGYIRVWHPDTVKAILKTTEPKFISYGMYRLGKDWLGECLLLNSGKKWARNRKLMSSAFHFEALRKFIKIKNQCSQILLDKLLNYSEGDKSVDMFEHFCKLTADILLRCSFSRESDIQQEGRDEPYLTAVTKLTQLWLWRSLSPWLYPNWIYRFTSNGRKWAKNIKVVHEFSGGVIAERKKNFEKSNEKVENKKNDFLDILLTARDEDGNGLNDTEIMNEVAVIMFAGHDTSSSALSWTAYSLASNHVEQRRCQDEIDALMDGRESDEINNEDLNQLPYLTMCIKESMRLHTVVPMIERELSKPLTIDNVQLPRHTMVAVFLIGLHLSEEIWEEPMVFKPERFLPENLENMDPYSFVPFSAGPRNCLGQNFAMNELKIVLARLLRRVTFKLDPENIPRHLINIVMKSENGMHLYIEKRNNIY